MTITFDILEKSYNLKMLGKTWSEVCFIFGVKERTLRDNLIKQRFDISLLPKNKKLAGQVRKSITEEEKQKALNLKKEGLTLDVISNKLNIPKYTLRKSKIHLINKEVDRIETYYTNLDYFNEINTEDKAYYLGLIYADGSVDTKRLRLELQKEDCYIIKKWRDIISPNRPIYYSKRKNKKATGCLTLNSKYWLDKLKVYNIEPRKSFHNTSLSKLSKEMMPHFVRGLFDGDGSVYINSNALRIKFIGNTLSIKELIDYLVKEINITPVKLHTGKPYKIYTSYFTIARKNDIKKLYDYMYDNSCFYLNRKKQLFDIYYSN